MICSLGYLEFSENVYIILLLIFFLHLPFAEAQLQSQFGSLG